MKKVDKLTVFGLIAGILFIVSGVIESGKASYFWNVPSAFIIIGGTIASVIVAFPYSRLRTFWPVMKRAFVRDKFDIKEDITTLVTLADIARKDNFLVLEDAVDQYTDDKFIKMGIQLIVDGADEDQLRDALNGSTYFMVDRHQKGAAMLKMVATIAPALGLVGTYVGLIPMLVSLDEPTTLGPAMAVELVSSFYGGFISYIIFSPLSKRLKIMSEEEVTRREMLVEGLASIQQRKNPRLLKEELLSYTNLDVEITDEWKDAPVRKIDEFTKTRNIKNRKIS